MRTKHVVQNTPLFLICRVHCILRVIGKRPESQWTILLEQLLINARCSNGPCVSLVVRVSVSYKRKRVNFIKLGKNIFVVFQSHLMTCHVNWLKPNNFHRLQTSIFNSEEIPISCLIPFGVERASNGCFSSSWDNRLKLHVKYHFISITGIGISWTLASK